MIKRYTLVKKLTFSYLFFTTILFSQETLSVDSLILKALKLSPDLQVSQSQYMVSKNRYDEAFGSYLPKIDFNAGVGVFGATDIFSGTKATINDSLVVGKLTLNQLVYDFGKTGGYTNSTQLESAASLSSHEQFISDKKREVKSAYYNVLKAKSLISVNVENVKLNEAQLYRSQKYFEAGIRTKIDISDAQVELIKSKITLNDADYNLKLAYASLDKSIGYMSPTRDYVVLHKRLDTKNINVSLPKYPLNLNDAIEYSYSHRNEIKKNLQLASAAKFKENITSSEYYPQIYFNSEYTKQNIGDKLNVFAPPTQYSAMLNLNWNLYSGGSSSARKQAQVSQTNISLSELAYSKLIVKTEVTNAYINLNSVQDSVVLSKSLLEASKEKFTQAGQRYEHGLSDYIELQQARQGYIDASAQLVVNYYNYFDALATLDNAIGK